MLPNYFLSIILCNMMLRMLHDIYNFLLLISLMLINLLLVNYLLIYLLLCKMMYNWISNNLTLNLFLLNLNLMAKFALVWKYYMKFFLGTCNTSLFMLTVVCILSTDRIWVFTTNRISRMMSNLMCLRPSHMIILSYYLRLLLSKLMVHNLCIGIIIWDTLRFCSNLLLINCLRYLLWTRYGMSNIICSPMKKMICYHLNLARNKSYW